MVESTSGNKPHLISPGKGGKFTCDSECPNYKSFAICSHVIAVAEVNRMLEEFISQFQKSKKVYPKGEDEREESQLERGENFLLQKQEYL